MDNLTLLRLVYSDSWTENLRSRRFQAQDFYFPLQKGRLSGHSGCDEPSHKGMHLLNWAHFDFNPSALLFRRLGLKSIGLKAI